MTDAMRRPAALRSGGSRRSVAILAAVVIVLAAACDRSSASPSPTATASARSWISPNGSIRPSGSPKVDAGSAAIAAFVALVTKDGFSYQATFTGNDRHSTDIIPMRDGLLQVSGDDVLVRVTFSFQGQRSVSEHRYVDGKAWIRYDTSDTWHRLIFKPSNTMAAFAAIRTRADVTYLGPVKSADRTYYKVSFRSAIVNPVMIPASNLTEQVVTSPKLTLLIDADGRPVKGTAEIDGTGRVSGQLQEIVIDLTVAFAKLGQAVSIKAP